MFQMRKMSGCRVSPSSINSERPKERFTSLANDTTCHCRCKRFANDDPGHDRKEGKQDDKWKHIHARESDHRLPERLDVPDSLVCWDKPWPGGIEDLEYNRKVKTWSLMTDETEIYPAETGNTCQPADIDKVKNPYGRTGLRGRGILPKLGPNPAAEPVITRSVMFNGGKQTQVLVCRQYQVQGHTFALPGGLLSDSELKVNNELEARANSGGSDKAKIDLRDKIMMPGSKRIKKFLEHVLTSNLNYLKKKLEERIELLAKDLEESYKLNQALEQLDRERKRSLVKLDLALKSGRKVYPNERYIIGYCDDPRNTDNAWVEAEVYHFHISGAASGEHDLYAIHGAHRLWDVENSRKEQVKMEFKWLNVDKGSTEYRMLYASSKFFVDQCLPECKCGRTVYDRQDGSHRCLKYAEGPRELARSILRGIPVVVKDLSEYHLLLVEHEREKLSRTARVHTAARQPTRTDCVESSLKQDEVVRGSTYDLESDNFVNVHDDAIRNPFGRIGACGWGKLPQLGANPARHAVVTRVDGSSGRTQVLLWKTKEGTLRDWHLSLPNTLALTNQGEENDPGEPSVLVLDFLMAVLAHNTKERCSIDSQDYGVLEEKVPTQEELKSELSLLLLHKGTKVYPDDSAQLYKRGYCYDPRNTDDAWVETEVKHYHLPSAVASTLNLGELVGLNPWTPKDMSQLKFSWVDVAITRTYSEQLFAAGVCFFAELCVPDCICGLPKYDNTDGMHEDKAPSSALEFLMNCQLTSAASALEQLASASQIEFFKAEKVQGLMQFEGRSAVARFVRAAVSGRYDAVAVCRALFGGTRPQVGSPEMWSWDDQDKFWRPQAIISVTGGAQGFILDRGMRKKIFADGILKTAVAMKALIIDGGTSAGVMEMVGEAVLRESRATALGICPWGAVLGKQHLLCAEKNANLQNESTISAYKISEDHRNSEWGARLDPNHRYVALIDTGFQGGKKAFESEIHGRVCIEKELSCGASSLKFVPHVLVVVNGGLGTIKTVYTLSIQGNKDDQITRTVPIVAVEGTKRAADMIAHCWRHLHEGALRTCTSGQQPRRCCVSFIKAFRSDGKGETVHCPFLRTTYMKCFSLREMDETHERSLAMIVAVCRVKERVTVYNCNMSTSLRLAIMKAVFTSYSMHKKNVVFKSEKLKGNQDYSLQECSPLEMLLEWEDAEAEAVELVKRELVGFTESSDSFAPNYNVLYKALKQNKHRFVEILHDSGYFAHASRLHDEMDSDQRLSYGEGPLDYQAIMKKYLDWHRIEWGRQVIHGKGFRTNSYVSLQSSRAPCLEGTQLETSNTEDAVQDRFKKSEEMFLWSIVQGRQEIAEIYFRNGHPSSRQQSIARALFACSVARSISQSPAFGGSARDRDKLEALASHFENIATDILDCCARLSQRSAASSLTVPFFEPWIRSDCGWVDGNEDFLTPIGMAYTACASSVVKHDAFQESLDRIWYGRLVSDLEKERTASIDLFRGTLIQLPQIGASLPGNVIASAVSVFGTFAVDGVVIFFIAVFPFLAPLLKLDKDDSIAEGVAWGIAGGLACGITGGIAGGVLGHIAWGISGGIVGCAVGGIAGCLSLSCSGLSHKLCAFYTAPCTKFILAFCSYLCFVVLYTYVGFVLDRDYTPLEGVMHAWILALYVAEARQRKCEGPLLWARNGSNILDALMLLAYLPAFFLRMFEIGMSEKNYRRLGGWSNGVHADLGFNSTASYEHADGDLRMARSWHGIAGIFFWIRTFYFLRVSSTLGPLWVVLVKVTCKDVVYFVIFLVVFLVSFGAAIICAARPSHDPSMPFSEFLSHTFYFPYMEIFGEHFLDSSPYFSSHPGGNTEHDNRVLGTLLLCIYLLFSTIVLMNLLIAQMNSTYNAVHDESITTWKFQRLGLVLEFAQSSVLPAPLGIFEDLLLLCSCGTAGSSVASSHGAHVIWASHGVQSSWATKSGADDDIVGSLAGSPSCIGGARTSLPEPVLRYLRDARDWVQWMAAASVVNLQHSWAGWWGYFPQGWDWKHGEGYHRCLNPPIQTGMGTGVHRMVCPCEVCQASSLRRSADLMVEALEGWARTRAEKDTERNAAVEAAATSASAAEKMARLQEEKEDHDRSRKEAKEKKAERANLKKQQDRSRPQEEEVASRRYASYTEKLILQTSAAIAVQIKEEVLAQLQSTLPHGLLRHDEAAQSSTPTRFQLLQEHASTFEGVLACRGPKCGMNLLRFARFCHNCGAPVETPPSGVPLQAAESLPQLSKQKPLPSDGKSSAAAVPAVTIEHPAVGAAEGGRRLGSLQPLPRFDAAVAAKGDQSAAGQAGQTGGGVTVEVIRRRRKGTSD